eukprot:2096630-Pyramimonas_sp.AAC.1
MGAAQGVGMRLKISLRIPRGTDEIPSQFHRRRREIPSRFHRQPRLPPPSPLPLPHSIRPAVLDRRRRPRSGLVLLVVLEVVPLDLLGHRLVELP